ncbi:MAG: hypothetical protein ACRDRH_24625 [Pseudonocardia sp.]
MDDLQAALLEFEAVAVALEAWAAERAASEPREEDTPDWLADTAGCDRDGGRGGTMSGGGDRS